LSEDTAKALHETCRAGTDLLEKPRLYALWRESGWSNK
jgi:hypothetical protein